MKRFTKLATRCLAVACVACLLAVMAGCASQEEYTPPEKSPTLASPAIGKDGVLRVGVNTQNQPLAGVSTSSQNIVGLDVDIAAYLADSFGLKLELVDVGTDAQAALDGGTVDIVMGVDKSGTDASFWMSDTYLPTAIVLFSTPGNTTVPTNESQPSIAAQVSSKSAWAVTNEFDQGNIVTTSDLQSAFSSLESGQVQYVASDAIIGTHAAHTADDEVQIVALMQQPSGYCIGVLDTNSDLKQAISDALAALSGNGVVSLIETKWLGTTLDLSTLPLTAGATTPAASKTSDEGAEEGTDEGESSDGDTGESGEEAPTEPVSGERGPASNAVSLEELTV